MCFYKEGPARVLPSMQKGFRGPRGGLGQEGSYPGPAREGISRFFDSYLLSFSP